MESERSIVMSTRVPASEGGRIKAIATADGISVSELLHRLVMPAVDARLRKDLATAGCGDDEHA